MECERSFPILIFAVELFASLMTDQISETLSVLEDVRVCVNARKYGGFWHGWT